MPQKLHPYTLHESDPTNEAGNAGRLLPMSSDTQSTARLHYGIRTHDAVTRAEQERTVLHHESHPIMERAMREHCCP